ncbi:MAG: DUF3833 domain-containing protein [Kangiellaceae bacterium]|jgi:hypothetical protein|nr:DUF3833 domain-containing protein [Kangiellaceae bacterium]
MKKLFITLVAVSIFLLSSCSTTIRDYKGTKPVFNIKEYFNGPVVAWGMVQDYNEKLTRRFCVEMTGTWEGNKGVLDEYFYWADGEKSRRVWKLTVNDDGTISGSADDVVGVASGESSGLAFQWNYVLKVKVDDSEYEFSIDDWMYQFDQYRLFNRSFMSKFGFEVAEITLFFDKEQPLRKCDKNIPDTRKKPN